MRSGLWHVRSMEGLDACDWCMGHSGSRSGLTLLCAGVFAGASTDPDLGAAVLRRAASAALGTELAKTLTVRPCSTLQRWLEQHLQTSDRSLQLGRSGRVKRAELESHFERNSTRTAVGGRQTVPVYSCSFREPPAVSRPPTDGRPRKRFMRCGFARHLHPSASCAASCWRSRQSTKQPGA